MFNMRLDQAVIVLVDNMLPAFSGNKCLYVCLRVSKLESWKLGAKKAGKYIHLIFNRSSSYTKVFAAVSDYYHRPDIEKFVMKADHDECWRDGVRQVMTEAYFGLSKEVNARKAPKNLEDWASIDNVRFIDAEFAKDKNDPCGWMKVITFIGERQNG